MIFKIVRKVKTVLTYFLVYYPIYFFSFLTPRKKNRWIFGAGYNFAENPKYLLIEIIEKYPEIDAYWIAKDKRVYESLIIKGIPAAYIWSVKGIYFLFTSGVYISYSHLHESIYFWSLGRAKQINLWHGIALKNIGFSKKIGSQAEKLHNPFLKVIYKLFYLHLYRQPDIFLTTSPTTARQFKRSFGLDDICLVEANYPRCSVLTFSESARGEFIKNYENEILKAFLEELKLFSRAIIYMPTWRDGAPCFLSFEADKINRLNLWCKSSNSVFVFKLHPKTPISQLDKLKNYSNIRVMESTLDIYPILPEFDLLITDYSSIYFDFMHIKNSYILFYPFDYEQYISRDRDLAFDYDENITGMRVNTFDELIECLEKESYKNVDKEKNQALYEKFWGKPEDKKDLIAEIKKVAGLS